jgi:hypothetical protein
MNSVVIDPTPEQIAASIIRALADYSDRRVVEIQDVHDLERLVKQLKQNDVSMFAISEEQ